MIAPSHTRTEVIIFEVHCHIHTYTSRPDSSSCLIPFHHLVPFLLSLVFFLGFENAAANVQVQCYSNKMRFVLPYSIANKDSFSHPCLAGDVSDDTLRSYWGNQHLAPGSPAGPLRGHCYCPARNDSQYGGWVFDIAYGGCGTRVAEEHQGKVSVCLDRYSP